MPASATSSDDRAKNRNSAAGGNAGRSLWGTEFVKAGVLSALTVLLLSAQIVFAEDMEPKARDDWFNPDLKRAAPLAYKAVLPPNAKPTPGDLWRTMGFFGSWRIVCDTLISASKKTCQIQQDIDISGAAGQERGGMRLDIALSDDGQPHVFIYAPPDAERDKGVTVIMDGATSATPFEYCNSQHCRAERAFNGVIRTAFLTENGAIAAFTRRGRLIGGSVSLVGLTQTIAASGSRSSIIGTPLDSGSGRPRGARRASLGAKTSAGAPTSPREGIDSALQN
jgi:hypothetical protein